MDADYINTKVCGVVFFVWVLFLDCESAGSFEVCTFDTCRPQAGKCDACQPSETTI